MERDGREEGMLSEGWVMTSVGDLEWTELTEGIEEEVKVALFRAVIKG